MCNEQIVKYEVDGKTVQLSPNIIEKFLVSGNSKITAQEVNFFIHLCRARKLNPFLKEVYLIKYGTSPANMVVSKDVLERRAIKNKNYDGKKMGIFVKNKNNEIEKREFSIILKNEELLGAWCSVYRKDWDKPLTAEVNLDEYIGKDRTGNPTKIWKEKPVTMILKVAKSHALREAFIEDLSQLYDASEMASIMEEKDENIIEVEEQKEIKKEIIKEKVKVKKIEDTEDIIKELFEEDKNIKKAV